MPAILIKDLTVQAHKSLREMAKSHQRSMQKEAALILNSLLAPMQILPMPKKFKLAISPGRQEIMAAIKEGRR